MYEKLIENLVRCEEELAANRVIIEKLEEVIKNMFETSQNVMSCWPTSRLYAIFLKEQWHKFQMKKLKEQIPYYVDTPKDFTNMCP